MTRLIGRFPCVFWLGAFETPPGRARAARRFGFNELRVDHDRLDFAHVGLNYCEKYVLPGRRRACSFDPEICRRLR